MSSKSFLLLYIAILCQGLASGASRPRNHLSLLEDNNGVNINLDPDNPSILATLEHLQNENNQLRQDMLQSQAQMMALVRGLQEDNSKLKQQQKSNLELAMAKIADVGKEVSEHLQNAGQQVQMKVSEMLDSVGEVKDQQDSLMERLEVVEVVWDVVKEFQDEAHNVTVQVTNIQNRMTSLEARVSQLQMEANDDAKQLAALKQRLDMLESLLQDGNGKSLKTTTPSTPATTKTTPKPTITNKAPTPTSSSPEEAPGESGSGEITKDDKDSSPGFVKPSPRSGFVNPPTRSVSPYFPFYFDIEHLSYRYPFGDGF